MPPCVCHHQRQTRDDRCRHHGEQPADRSDHVRQFLNWPIFSTRRMSGSNSWAWLDTQFSRVRRNRLCRFVDFSIAGKRRMLACLGGLGVFGLYDGLPVRRTIPIKPPMVSAGISLDAATLVMQCARADSPFPQFIILQFVFFLRESCGDARG